MAIKINTSEIEKIRNLKCGDMVLLSGEIYTARDAAHKRLCEAVEKGEKLPFSPKDKIIYYAGPTPAPPGYVIGSAGPTTSGRMDSFAPLLYARGLCATIGKGGRSGAVKVALREHGGLYLCAVGGAGALLGRCVTSCEEIAFAELGCESVKRLTVKDMPLIVAMDSAGGDLFAPSAPEA